MDSDTTSSWRNASAGFKIPEGGGQFNAGVLAFCPGGFMQARDVSYVSYFLKFWSQEIISNFLKSFELHVLFNVNLGQTS
jgi:hypothetical protein